MPAKSKAQQKFMGMVHAAKKGEKPASKEVAKAAKGMSGKAAKDFAGTKHKGLPEKVKKSKTEESLLNDFEQAISEVTVTSGPNKGKQWSPKTPGPTNKNYKEIDGNIPSPPDGATAPPPGYKPPKGSLGGPKGDRSVGTPMKKAEVTTSDDAEMTAEAKQTYGGKGKQMTKSEHDADVKKKKEKEKMKKMAEAFIQIGRLEQMIFEAKKKGDGNLANNAKPYDKVTRGDVIAGRLGKDEMGGKKKDKKVEEAEEKCNHTPKGKKCPVHGLKECGSMYEAKKEKEPEGLYSKKRFETDSQRVARLAKEKRQAEKKKADEKTNEGNDGNLANNAKPYDKVTRGDVIAGRLGKDEMGGKKKKNSKTTETFMPKKPKTEVPQPTDVVKDAVKKATDKFIKPKAPSNLPKVDTKADVPTDNKTSKDAWGPSDIADVNEGWTHDSLAAQLFESGDEYMVSLHNRLAKQLKG